jgi:DNA processing protein
MKIITEENLKHKIALTLIPGVGNVIARNLVSYCGSVEGVFKESKKHLEKIPDVGPVTAEAIKNHRDFEKAENECLFIEKYNVTPLFYLDKNYPVRLKNCSDAPVMLYYKGNADLNSKRIVAIVGSRSATEYGKTITEKMIADLKNSNAIIVSGLAYGIDVCAHKAALKNEMETVGVLAHGLDRVYPGLHRSIAEKMIEHGGLLTEYLTETNPDKENFPQRNRIVAGISDAVVVIEAAKKGGALITAEIANTYNRDVFAVPGRLNDTFSEGCNHLIKTNKAALIETSKDIEYIMGWEEKQSKKVKNAQRNLFVELNAEEKSLVDLINQNGSMDIDTICSNITLPVSKVSATLLNLEFKGMVKSLPGKVYELI